MNCRAVASRFLKMFYCTSHLSDFFSPSHALKVLRIQDLLYKSLDFDDLDEEESPQTSEQCNTATAMSHLCRCCCICLHTGRWQLDPHQLCSEKGRGWVPCRVWRSPQGWSSPDNRQQKSSHSSSVSGTLLSVWQLTMPCSCPSSEGYFRLQKELTWQLST